MQCESESRREVVDLPLVRRNMASMPIARRNRVVAWKDDNRMMKVDSAMVGVDTKQHCRN
jgi:hypothetical protein